MYTLIHTHKNSPPLPPLPPPPHRTKSGVYILYNEYDTLLIKAAKKENICKLLEIAMNWNYCTPSNPMCKCRRFINWEQKFEEKKFTKLFRIIFLYFIFLFFWYFRLYTQNIYTNTQLVHIHAHTHILAFHNRRYIPLWFLFGFVHYLFAPFGLVGWFFSRLCFA